MASNGTGLTIQGNREWWIIMSLVRKKKSDKAAKLRLNNFKVITKKTRAVIKFRRTKIRLMSKTR